MNVIWMVADTLRRDHLGAYGNRTIRTPSLDALAAESIRFDRHYAAAFPTMPTRADHFSGRWTMSFMRWQPLPPDFQTLAQLLSRAGIHAAAVVDTPFYLRHGMNYDRGFQTFFSIAGQEGSATRLAASRHHESRDQRAWWRHEADRNAPQTMLRAMEWLERHRKDHFFLYIDTWDPHEPWDAPEYYSELYWPDYDGEVIPPVYGRWQDVPGMTEEKVRKAHATYQGEITMVDTWVGYLLRRLENMGLLENTALVFTSDHGFYFGEHGGLFGKMSFAKRPDGSLYRHGEPGAIWSHSPLYEEVVALPLLLRLPEVEAGAYRGLTSAVDLMPTVLELLGAEVPSWVEGRSLRRVTEDRSTPGRDFVVTSIPFANPGDEVDSVDNVSRRLDTYVVTTITTEEWSLLYTPEAQRSELYHLPSDQNQQQDLAAHKPDVAAEVHRHLVAFLEETGVSDRLANPRRELRI